MHIGFEWFWSKHMRFTLATIALGGTVISFAAALFSIAWYHLGMSASLSPALLCTTFFVLLAWIVLGYASKVFMMKNGPIDLNASASLSVLSLCFWIFLLILSRQFPEMGHEPLSFRISTLTFFLLMPMVDIYNIGGALKKGLRFASVRFSSRST